MSTQRSSINLQRAHGASSTRPAEPRVCLMFFFLRRRLEGSPIWTARQRTMFSMCQRRACSWCRDPVHSWLSTGFPVRPKNHFLPHGIAAGRPPR
eukprot:8534405-Lingulodinium_polyedra.AAC.1